MVSSGGISLKRHQAHIMILLHEQKAMFLLLALLEINFFSYFSKTDNTLLTLLSVWEYICNAIR